MLVNKWIAAFTVSVFTVFAAVSQPTAQASDSTFLGYTLGARWQAPAASGGGWRRLAQTQGLSRWRSTTPQVWLTVPMKSVTLYLWQGRVAAVEALSQEPDKDEFLLQLLQGQYEQGQQQGLAPQWHWQRGNVLLVYDRNLLLGTVTLRATHEGLLRRLTLSQWE